MSLPRFSVRNSVFVNVLMVLVIAMGTFALFSLPRELFPQVRLNRVVVIVNLPGASPEEVEKLITKPIEDEIKDLDHLDLYLSTSTEGQSHLMVIFKQIDEDRFARAYQELRQEVDKVDLPDDADDPFFFSIESSTWLPMATLAIAGELPEKRLGDIAEEWADELKAVSGVDDVVIAGRREREIWVEVDPDRLYKHNLTLEQVSAAIRRQNLTLPSGNLDVGDYEYMVRSVEEFTSPSQIGEVVIVRDDVGNHVRIKDVATIRDTFEEPRTLSRLDGQPCLTLNVYKTPDGNTLELVDLFEQMAAEKSRGLPSDVRLAVVRDTSARIKDAIGLLLNNGMFGGFLVLAMLLLFLGWRNALFVAWGIPITFLLTFVFVELYGESLNQSTLFALVLVLGMIVDDAIVVVENIARYLNRGWSPTEAAVAGAQEVMWPVVSSSLTTIAAFLPLMLLPGVVGEFMRVIPVCVTMALAASLFEALVILPSHVADMGRSDRHRHHSRVNRAFRFFGAHYCRGMGWALRRRWIYLPLILLLILSSFSVIPLVGVDLYEDDEMPSIFVRVWMPEGSRIESTDRVLRLVEQAALTLPKSEVDNVVTQVGVVDTESQRTTGRDVGQVFVNLVEQYERTRSVDEIIAELRGKLRLVTGQRRIQIAKAQSGPPVGKPIEVKVKGRHFDDIEAVSERVQAFLSKIPGVHSIQDDFEQGKNEVRIRVDEGRAHLAGIDVTDIARQVQAAFEGRVATVYRDGDEEIDVVVKFQPQFRDSIQDIRDLRIPTHDGMAIPFDSVASYAVERGFADIERFNGERAITVTADVVPEQASAVAVVERLREEFADIGREYPGCRLDFRGEFKEFEEAFQNVTRLFLIGLILMYLILAAQFRSYMQPVLVLFAVPFAFAGAMLCLLVNGFQFSINVMFGMVALSGVAVNDSIVLISFINDSRARGASLMRAVLNASKRRLRPIFLTTVTTIFGLLPMAMGLGGKSITWVPLSATIVWGLGAATLLILLVMPPLYVALEDVRRVFRRKTPGG